jgi:hypothetical protein
VPHCSAWGRGRGFFCRFFGDYLLKLLRISFHEYTSECVMVDCGIGWMIEEKKKRTNKKKEKVKSDFARQIETEREGNLQGFHKQFFDTSPHT